MQEETPDGRTGEWVDVDETDQVLPPKEPDLEQERLPDVTHAVKDREPSHMSRCLSCVLKRLKASRSSCCWRSCSLHPIALPPLSPPPPSARDVRRRGWGTEQTQVSARGECTGRE